MTRICPICFRDTEKEPHQDWCKNKPPSDADFFNKIFPGLNIKEKKDERT